MGETYEEETGDNEPHFYWDHPFDLHYKEYNGALPWRGNTKFIVDKVVNMK